MHNANREEIIVIVKLLKKARQVARTTQVQNKAV
jgi:hypothetical protein